MMFRAYAALVLFMTLCHPGAAQVQLGSRHFNSGGTCVQPGDVYGTATFSISTYGQQDVASVLYGLTQSLIQSELITMMVVTY